MGETFLSISLFFDSVEKLSALFAYFDGLLCQQLVDCIGSDQRTYAGHRHLQHLFGYTFLTLFT